MKGRGRLREGNACVLVCVRDTERGRLYVFNESITCNLQYCHDQVIREAVVYFVPA